MGQANSSPYNYACPLPTRLLPEELALLDAPGEARNHLNTRAEQISSPVLRRQAMFLDGYARRCLPTAPEQAAARKRNQALYRDRQRRKDLAPDAYRESKLDETCTSDALRSRLAELGASTPSCVFVDEVSKQQAKAASKYGRFSIYADRRGRHVAETFTGDEFDRLVDDGYDQRGRDLPVFDREGQRYGFEFTYSEEHGYYRLTGIGAEYERFTADNNVVRDVVELGKKMTMQIFAFRSPKLLPEGKGFHDHPDGALGMIILFSESEDEDEYADYIELDDDSMTVKEMVEHIRQNQKATH